MFIRYSGSQLLFSGGGVKRRHPRAFGNSWWFHYTLKGQSLRGYIRPWRENLRAANDVTHWCSGVGENVSPERHPDFHLLNPRESRAGAAWQSKGRVAESLYTQCHRTDHVRFHFQNSAQAVVVSVTVVTPAMMSGWLPTFVSIRSRCSGGIGNVIVIKSTHVHAKASSAY
ncbi:hypothetical protein KCP78_11465 [Salmonella enterica subsp. enterica]|nr:hypothetical protein KCP78_11465 [Salmonella enterica subsp. enterica]